MATGIFCAESMVYRTAGMIDRAMASIDKSQPGAPTEMLKAIEEYAVECSIIKVANSEILDFVVDEGVQIFGGYGYSEDYPVERCYRDARVNRIFEGTNEINRLLITGMLLKRATKGQLGLLPAAQKLLTEILSFPPLDHEEEEILSQEKRIIANCKKTLLLTLGVAFQKFQDAISDQQEVLSRLSDLVISIFGMESMLLRVLKRAYRDGTAKLEFQQKAVQLYTHSTLPRIEDKAKQILAAVSEGDELRTQLAALRRFTKNNPLNLIALRRDIARKLREEGRYCLSA
jgi:alkylation response protein AidB-like acyl-CoA dehydrogenase